HLVDLDGGPAGGEGGAVDDDDGGAGRQAEQGALAGARHAGADLLGEVGGGQAEVAQPGVDAAGAGLVLGDGAVLDEVGGEVGAGQLHGPGVDEVAAPADPDVGDA